MPNATIMIFCATMVEGEKQYVLHIPSVYL